MRKIGIFTWLLWVGFSGCSTAPVKSGIAEATRAQLFPYGVYRQEVQITIHPTAQTPERKMDMSGVMRFSVDAIQLVGLSHFGTTVFRIREDRKTGEVKTEVFMDQLKPLTGKISEYYKILRLFILADKKQLKGISPLEIDFFEFDANQIPSRVLIRHPAFEVIVKVAGYEI